MNCQRGSDYFVKSCLFILTVTLTPNSDGANMADHLCVTGQAKPFIKESWWNMTARALSQRIKYHVPWHLIQTQKVSLSICMRHTGLQTPSNTNPSALIWDNHRNCTMRRSFQIERVGGVELEWRVTHNFYPGDQSFHPVWNQMSQIFSLS